MFTFLGRRPQFFSSARPLPSFLCGLKISLICFLQFIAVYLLFLGYFLVSLFCFFVVDVVVCLFFVGGGKCWDLLGFPFADGTPKSLILEMR